MLLVVLSQQILGKVGEVFSGVYFAMEKDMSHENTGNLNSK